MDFLFAMVLQLPLQPFARSHHSPIVLTSKGPTVPARRPGTPWFFQPPWPPSQHAHACSQRVPPLAACGWRGVLAPSGARCVNRGGYTHHYLGRIFDGRRWAAGAPPPRFRPSFLPPLEHHVPPFAGSRARGDTFPFPLERKRHDHISLSQAQEKHRLTLSLLARRISPPRSPASTCALPPSLPLRRPLRRSRRRTSWTCRWRPTASAWRPSMALIKLACPCPTPSRCRPSSSRCRRR